MKPPVEAPTSRQREPVDVDPEVVEGMLELEAAAGDVPRPLAIDEELHVIGSRAARAYVARGPSRPILTLPARTDSAALVRDPASPRSASSVSIRRRSMGANGTWRTVQPRAMACGRDPGVCDCTHRQIAHTFVISSAV